MDNNWNKDRVNDSAEHRNSPKSEKEQNQSFLSNANNLRKRFPIIFNLLLMGALAMIVIWVLLLFLGKWTNHGVEQVVPDVKGQNLHVAIGNLEKEGFETELADSIFDNVMMPGTVVEQNPHSGSKVKPGRTVYLTIVAYTPKTVSVPDITNTSLRQGQSMLEGAGFRNITVKYVPSLYQDLVLGATANGKPLLTGQKLPVNTPIILEVGEGTGEDMDSEFDEIEPDDNF